MEEDESEFIKKINQLSEAEKRYGLYQVHDKLSNFKQK